MRSVFVEILVCFYAHLQANKGQQLTISPSVLTVESFNVKIQFNYKNLFDFLNCTCHFKTCTLTSHPSTSYDTRVKSVTGHEENIKFPETSTIGCTVNNIKGDDELISVNATCRSYQNTCTNKITITNSSLIGNNKCLSQCFEIGWEDSTKTKISFFDTDILTVDNCTSKCKDPSNHDSPLENDDESTIGVAVIVVITAICILIVIFIVMFIFRYRRKLNTSMSADSHFKNQDISKGSEVFKTSQYSLAIKCSEHETSKNCQDMESRYCGNSPKLDGGYVIKPYNFSPPVRQSQSTTQIASSSTNQPAVCVKKKQQWYQTETDELNTQEPEKSSMNHNVTEFYDPKIYYVLEIKED